MFEHAKTTKERLLNIIKTSGKLSISEMACQIGITEMAVRRHIQTLERDALVESVIQKPTKGRPSKLYQLSRNGEERYPKRYKQLNMELLKELEDMGQTALISELFDKRKNRLLAHHQLHTKGKSFLEKLKMLRELQASEGFMPEMTEADGTIHFKEFNCPFIDIAVEYQQMCKSETEFIKGFLDVESVEVKSCMASGDHCCHYVIRQN